MRKLKLLISTALMLSILGATGCSNTNIPSSSNLQTPVIEKNSAQISSVNPVSIEKINKTASENLDFTAQEINEIKNLIKQNPEMLKSENKKSNFGVKTLQQGRDVSIDMLLYHPKAASRAHFWGIKTAEDLLNAGSSPTKRWFLERKLGGLFASKTFKVQVLFWVERADFLRLKNVSLEDSFLLMMAGVTSVPHLATCNNPISQGALAVSLALLAFQYGYPIPDVNEIKTWTQEATMMTPVLY